MGNILSAFCQFNSDAYVDDESEVAKAETRDFVVAKQAMKPASSRYWDVKEDGNDGLDTSTKDGGRTGRLLSSEFGSDNSISPEKMEKALAKVKGSISFRNLSYDQPPIHLHASPKPIEEGSEPEVTADEVISPSEDPEASRSPKDKAPNVADDEAKRKAHEEEILSTFYTVMKGDGLKVLKRQANRSQKGGSRVIRYVPEYNGALVWNRPQKKPGATSSRVPLAAISEVELERTIVWISAGGEKVGFETSQEQDADLLYEAICILIDRSHLGD